MPNSNKHKAKLASLGIRSEQDQQDVVQEQHCRLFQEGHEKGLKFFFDEFHAALSLFANKWVNNRSVAEEIASETFVRIWKFHYKFDNYFKIRGYLYKTALTISQRIVQQEAKRANAIKIVSSEMNVSISPFEQIVRSETYRILHNYLRDLPPGSRTVLAMHYLEGKTTGEIAIELNLSPSTIKTQKAKGLEALRKKIKLPLFMPFLLSLGLFFASL